MAPAGTVTVSVIMPFGGIATLPKGMAPLTPVWAKLQAEGETQTTLQLGVVPAPKPTTKSIWWRSALLGSTVKVTVTFWPGAALAGLTVTTVLAAEALSEPTSNPITAARTTAPNQKPLTFFISPPIQH